MIVIDGGYFYAAAEVDARGNVFKTAPIIKYMVGWSEERVVRYVRNRGWKIVHRGL